MKRLGQWMAVGVLLMSCQLSLAANLTNDEQNTISIFKKTAPIVVNIHNMRKAIDRYQRQVDLPKGNGSGFFWDKSGRVVTNYHVIHGASSIAVTLKNNVTVKAKVVGYDVRRDIAVLQIKFPKSYNRSQISPLAIVDMDKLQVGQKTIAIGNPFGLDLSLTTGIISALGREVPAIAGGMITNMIQTDAAINPGNSGGPLLDSQGRLIGINTIIYSRSGTSSGVGFAIPVSTVERIVDQIIKYGRVKQPGIGVVLLGPSINRQLGIKGVIIGKVMQKTPAASLKLRGTRRDHSGRIKLGDQITSINGVEIKDYNDLYRQLDKINIGEKIKLGIMRDGKKHAYRLKTIDLK